MRNFKRASEYDRCGVLVHVESHSKSTIHVDVLVLNVAP